MLGRRASTTPVVDDRGAPYPPLAGNAPQQSFNSPEGEYVLAHELCLPPPATPATPGGNNAAAAAAAMASQSNEYPATLTTAVIIFPPSNSSSGSGGLLGLGGGSQRNARAREASVSAGSGAPHATDSSNLPNTSIGGGFTPLAQASGNNADDQASSSHSGSSYNQQDHGAGPAASSGAGVPQNMANSPAGATGSKRRPLMSLPSMSSMPLPSLGGGNANTNASSGSSSTSKPKSAFRGTSSNFVKSYEGLPLSGRAEKMWQGPEAREVTLAIFTTPRATMLADISPRAKFRDPIAKIGFAATPTCTAVNMSTLSHDRLDLLIGFNTGDIVWVEAFTGRYSRYNKDPTSAKEGSTKQANSNASISASPVRKLQWLSGDQIFASAFQDGCVAFWDKDKEDPNVFNPTVGLPPDAGPNSSSIRTPLAKIDSRTDSMINENSEDGHGTLSKPSRRCAPFAAPIEEYTDDIVVTVAPPQVDKKSSSNKLNPIAHWKVSRKALTDFALSPDDQYCAVTSEDGCLRIIECSTQRLLDTFQGYFGALTCVNWSPDGRFVLTGGQDDLTCVWSPFEQRIVARCEGHSSFLTGLSFDPWRCDSRTQRFASVSEDCKLILWDLSSAALQRPKVHHHHTQQAVPQHHRRTSASAMSSLSLSRRRTIESSANLPSTAVDREGPLWHPAPKRSEVPGLQPITVKQISSELLAGVQFLAGMVVTISRAGTIKVFVRPEHRT